MAVTPTTIATALGRADSLTVTESAQWQMWIDDAEMLIDTRAAALGIVGPLDVAKYDYVVREAVVAHIRRPDAATQVTVSVNDASTSRTYRSGRGRVEIHDEWWTLLGLAATSGKAFEVDTMPADAGVGLVGVDYWWSSPTTFENYP